MQLITFVIARRCIAALAVSTLTLACIDGRSLMGPNSSPRLTHGEAHGHLYIMVQTDPDGAPDLFSFSHNVGTSNNPFTLDDGGLQTFNSIVAGQYTVTQNPQPGWDLVAVAGAAGDEEATGCFEDKTNNSQISLATGVASINVEPGETVVCTFVSRKRATLALDKRENGSLPLSEPWTFELRTGASAGAAGTVHAAGSANTETGVVAFACASESDPNCSDVDGVPHFVPGDYQLCETGMPAGYTNNLNGFTPAGAASEGNQNATDCVNVTLRTAQSETALTLLDLAYVDNVPGEDPPGEDPPGEDPPGEDPPTGQPSSPDPRGFTHWKNTASCTKGGHYENALASDDAAGTLDAYLPADAAVFPVGMITSLTCLQATSILMKRDLNGVLHASDAAYSLAAQLLAAKLNDAANAPVPECVATAMTQAQALLDNSTGSGVEFVGTGSYLGARSASPLRKTAMALANLLDRYNNNTPAVMGGDCT